MMNHCGVLVLLLAASLVTSGAYAKQRWFKRGYSDASQIFANDTYLQCEDYYLVKKKFLDSYPENSSITTYTWGPGPNTAACPQLNRSFSPMIWGAGTLQPPYNASIMPESATIKWNSVQGFCNPNLNSSDSAKMSPKEVAQLWPQIVALAKSRGDNDTVIVSPAMNECIDNCYPDDFTGDPVNWLKFFLANCTAMYPDTHEESCRMDAIAIHHYGNCTAEGLEKFIMLMYNAFQKPIWITEFGCHWWPQQSNADTLAYLKAVLPMLEANPAVQRYFYFTGRATGFNTTDLFTGQGADIALTEVGALYFGYPATYTD